MSLVFLEDLDEADYEDGMIEDGYDEDSGPNDCLLPFVLVEWVS